MVIVEADAGIQLRFLRASNVPFIEVPTGAFVEPDALMSLPQLIYQIDGVIRDTRASRKKKIKNLQNLAMTCWQEVVPEYGNPETSQSLESAIFGIHYKRKQRAVMPVVLFRLF